MSSEAYMRPFRTLRSLPLLPFVFLVSWDGSNYPFQFSSADAASVPSAL